MSSAEFMTITYSICILQDKNVAMILRNGLTLYMGSCGDETLRANWKLYCHLLQAHSAYMQAIVMRMKKKVRIDCSVIQEVFSCSDSILCSVRCENLKSKLTGAQLNNILSTYLEGIFSLAFEVEAQSVMIGTELQELGAQFNACMKTALEHAMINTFVPIMLNTVRCIGYGRFYWFLDSTKLT